jgi:putative ABC transport system permease protein
VKKSSFWIFRLAGREILANRKFSTFFCINLVLGLLGIVALGAFKTSIQTSMQAKSKFLLGADLSVSVRRPFTEKENAIIHETLKGAAETDAVEMYSMVKGKEITRLAEVRSIQNDYPFYGGFTLTTSSGAGKIISGGDAKDLQTGQNIWLSPELSLQLDAKVGDTVNLGDAKFTVSAIVTDDTSNSWNGFDLASPAWIGFSKVKSTGLVRPGSSVSNRKLFRLLPTQDLKRISKTLMHNLRDPGVKVTTHERASDQIGRILDYVDDYLGLVSLVALFFSALGAAFLFRSFLTQKLSEIAILITLGVTPLQAASVFMIQIAVLGTVAAALSVGIAGIVLPFMSAYVAKFLTVAIAAKLSLSSVVIAFLLGSVGSVLICLPLLQKVSRLKPSELFSESTVPNLSLDRSGILYSGMLAIVYWGLSCYEANSWWVGSSFVVGFLVAAVGLGAFGLLVLSLAKRFPTHRARPLSLRWRLSLRSLSRSRVSSLSTFLALGLGAMLLTLIPEIQINLQKEMLEPTKQALPSLFLFDIQDEQIKNLIQWVHSEKTELDSVTPMVRARMTEINGKPFERDEREYTAATREEEENARSKNRMFNLSYRAGLSDAETLVKGRNFSGEYDSGMGKPAELTLEKDFAGRLGLKVGDELTFDVEGVEIKGVAVGLRRVNWMSFQPNFFITFQPGVLDEAPKTWVGSIPPLPLDQKVKIQRDLVSQFSNVSAVDVENTVKKILAVFIQIGTAIRIMAILTLLSGFTVLFSISNHQANARKRETSLFKVLGADFSDVQAIFQRETLVIAFSASCIGAGLSLAFSFALVEFVFEMPWQPDFLLPFYSVTSITVVSVILTRFASRKALLALPISLLQES